MSAIRVGYPCINRTIPNGTTKTFRLASYSPERLCEAVSANLEMLHSILEYNVEHGLLNFRISSDVVPFASHEVCAFDWSHEFAKRFASIGDLARAHGMRLSLHPDQFTLINSPSEDIFARSVAELEYQSAMLDLMGMDASHKVQIHVGGAYGDKPVAMRRFVERYATLSQAVRRRLVIENDDRLFSLADCMELHRETGVPVLLDVFHHSINGDGKSTIQCIELAASTWREGPLMVDYSSQEAGKRVGTHAETLDKRHFRRFLKESAGAEFDLMLEIKDKEKSAVTAAAMITSSSSGPRRGSRRLQIVR